MTCPLSYERLVRYWTHDLPDAEVDEVDEHLFTCTACFEAAGRVAAMATGVRESLPVIALDRDIERQRARGVRMESRDFEPDTAATVRAPSGVDMLVFRLHAGVASVHRVSIAAPDGTLLMSFDDAPYDPSTGVVVVACQRHFVELFGQRLGTDVDFRFVVHGADATGGTTTRVFPITHGFD